MNFYGSLREQLHFISYTFMANLRPTLTWHLGRAKWVPPAVVLIPAYLIIHHYYYYITLYNLSLYTYKLLRYNLVFFPLGQTLLLVPRAFPSGVYRRPDPDGHQCYIFSPGLWLFYVLIVNPFWEVWYLLVITANSNILSIYLCLLGIFDEILLLN